MNTKQCLQVYSRPYHAEAEDTLAGGFQQLGAPFWAVLIGVYFGAPPFMKTPGGNQGTSDSTGNCE